MGDDGKTDMLEGGADKTKAKKARRCHQCHAPLDEHVGVKTGVGVCSLPHWHLCDGNIPEGDEAKGKPWAPCPEDEDSISDEEDEFGSGVSLSESDEIHVTGQQKKVLTVEEAAQEMNNAIQSGLGAASLASTVVDEVAERKDSSSTSDEEMREKQRKLEELQRQIASKKDSEVAAKLASAERKRERRLRREQKLAALDQQEKLLQKQLKQPKKSTAVKPSPRGSNGTIGDNSAQTGAKQKFLSDQVAEHEARRQQRAAVKKARQQQDQMSSLTIDGIRQLPDVQRQALELMTKLQGMIPSLAPDPSAASGKQVTNPPGSKASFQSGPSRLNPPISKYVYVASLGQTVPVVDTPADIPSVQSKDRQLSSDSDSEMECSEDEECPISPAPGQRFSWRRNEDGSKYFVSVPFRQRPVSPGLMWSYVLDKSTGRYERCQVPVQQSPVQQATKCQPKHSSSPRYKDHRVQFGMTAASGRTGQRHSQLRRDERQPTYVCPDTTEKQGKESRVPELVQYARECPVSWTSKVTTDKLNPILWSWAYISHLLATRTGHAPELKDGELEARLQHFLSVLEITLQTTNQSDFASDAWKVARLYHVKVQQKVDNGDYSWVQMLNQWGSATSPHELMAARAEIPVTKVAGTKVEGTVRGEGSGKGGTKAVKKGEKDEDERRKQVCFAWNNSETRGKCKWELDHEGETCIRMHVCSWCKGKDLKPLTHQKRFCRKRIEDEGE